ncbi:MAG TPA: alginate export family protein, partial [Candidatus Avalokitesvara rifleensis]|uniref:alginate export family protein n=1 Tax=Candidatus Avalokitesvara rifleensis TaxID=3367620 RepID=UPI004029F671
MMTGRFKTCMGVLLGSALALLYALPCSAESSSDLDQMQRELQALKAEMESLRADLGSGKEEIKVQNDELLASKKEYSQLSEQVRGLKQADPAEVSTLKDQLKKELGVVPNVYNDIARKIRIGFDSRTRAEYARNFAQITDATTNMWTPLEPDDSSARGAQRGLWQFSDGIASNDQTIVLQRTRINIDADVHDHLRAFFQLQDSRFWGVEAGTVRNQGALFQSGVDLGQNTLDMHQGYVDVRKLFNYPVTMRVGRQEIIWGDHRMMGNFDWDTIARSWDAIRGMYDTESHAAEAFAAIQRHDPAQNATTNSVGGIRQRDNDRQNYGFMWTFKKLVPDSTLQLMFLHDNDQLEAEQSAITVNQTRSGSRGNAKIYDVGYRIAGKVGKNIDYASESHYQLGRFYGMNHRAWAASVEGGYTFNEVGWKPRL